MSAETPGGTTPGLRGAFARLGGSLLGLVQTRLELAAVEFDEARERTVVRLVLVLVAVLAFAAAVVALSALVVVLFWDTYRIAALCGVALAYLLIGGGALWRLSVLGKTATPPFAATLAELERDRAWVIDRLGGDQ